MVPNGWKLVEAKDVCESISVGVVIKPTQYYVDENEGVKAFRSANVREGFINDTDWVYFSHEGHAANKKSQLKAGDILIVRTGYPGTACVVTPEFEGSNAIDIVIARPDMKQIISEYLCAYTNSHMGKSQVLDLQGGMAQKHLNVGAYQVLKIKLPPLPEQKKIAQILSTWDKAITTTEQMLANSQQQKKALMQQLLTGKKRLLDTNGVRFSGEWKVSNLSKLFERVTTKNNGQSTNVVTISGQHGLIRQEDFFKKTVASEILDGYFLLKQGQFAYNKSYSNGYPMGAIKRLNRYPDGVVTTLYICFELSDSGRADSDFWEHYFESGLLNKGLSQIAHEGGRAHGLLNVKPSDFFSLKVPTPSLEEQQKIAAVLCAADQEIIVLQQKLDALKQEKKALMQQLLTGKRRVLVS